MTCKELIGYLSSFKANDNVAFVVADKEKRLYYKISKCHMLSESPALFLDVTEDRSLDDFAEEADHD